jgi:hypothetical protein
MITTKRISIKTFAKLLITLSLATQTQVALAQTPAELDALTRAQIGVTRDFIRETTEKLNALSSQNAANPEFEHYDFVVKKRKKLERLEKVLLGLEQFLAGTYTKELTKITTKYSTIHQSQQYTENQKQALLEGVQKEFNVVVATSLRPTLNSFILKAASAACLNCLIPSQELITAMTVNRFIQEMNQSKSDSERRSSWINLELHNGYEFSKPFFSPATYTRELNAYQEPEFNSHPWLNQFELTVTDIHSGCVTSSCIALSRIDIADTLAKISRDLVFPVKAAGLQEALREPGSLVPGVGILSFHVRGMNLRKYESLEAGLLYSISPKEWQESHVALEAERSTALAKAYHERERQVISRILMYRNESYSEYLPPSGPISHLDEAPAQYQFEQVRDLLDTYCSKPNIPGGSFCLRTDAERVAFGEELIALAKSRELGMRKASKHWKRAVRYFFKSDYKPQ